MISNALLKIFQTSEPNARAMIAASLLVALPPIEFEHALVVRHLPPHHKNPFDRLLAAQSSAERLSIVSSDPTSFDLYGVQRI